MLQLEASSNYKVTNTWCMDLMVTCLKAPFKCMLSDPRERWSTANVILRLELHLYSPIVSWPISAELLLICVLYSSKYLFIMSTVCFVQLGALPHLDGVKGSQVWSASTAMAYWHVLHALLLSFVNSLINILLLTRWSKQSGLYGEQKPRPLKVACSKLDLWVRKASCYYSLLSAWCHL